jgi:hypothetical protein
MCRNIKPLFNYSPPVMEKDIHAAALQFVRKVSGYHEPSEINEAVFNQAVDNISKDVRTLLDSLVTKAPKRDREAEIKKACELAKMRFGK